MTYELNEADQETVKYICGYFQELESIAKKQVEDRRRQDRTFAIVEAVKKRLGDAAPSDTLIMGRLDELDRIITVVQEECDRDEEEVA